MYLSSYKMTPVIPSSTSNIFTIPGCSFDTRKINSLIRSINLTKVNKRNLYSQEFHLPLSKSLRLFPLYGSNHRPRFEIVSATGVDVAIEQVDQSESPVLDQDSGQSSETPLSTEKSNDEESSNKSKQRSRPVRKSEMPPVKDEELVPGATFTGKVRSIQPFGAFIDFGAFTDGLVHVSRLSDSYVKDVASVVSVGQEVKVKLVEANTETGRISLTMRENEPSGGGGDKSRSPKRNGKKSNEVRKATKFVKGQDLDGTVKNLTRSGAFINLPEGEEGFLPASEEADEGFGNIMGGSSMEIGQEVKVRVLRIARGQVTLTMKKEEDAKALNSKLQGKVFTATNPFLVAFRKNKDIAEFLDEREKVEELTAIDEDSSNGASVVEDKVDRQETVEVTETSSLVEDEEVKVEKESISSEVQIQTSDENTEISSLTPDGDEKVEPVLDEQVALLDEKVKPVEEKEVSSPPIVQDEETVEVTETSSLVEVEEVKVEKESISSEVQIQTSDENTEISSLTPDGDEKVEPVLDEQVALLDEKVKPVEEKEVSSPPIVQDETSSVASMNEEADASVIEKKIEETQTSEIVDNKIEETTTVEVDAEVPSAMPPLEDENVEQNSSVANSNATSETTETQTNEIVDNQIEETTPKVEVDAEVPSATLPLEDKNVEQNGSITESNVPSETTATISPALVKKLREETGAGMMDCKKALLETNGEIVKAQEYLRKKGLASADKKANRATAEGRIGSYVHDSRIGVLIEVNCETDFVSRGEIFKELVNDLAMQVAACPQVEYLVTEDVPQEIIEKEKSIEMQKEDLLSKPEQIRSKIVDGRIKKRVEELALLEQAYIKDDKMVVKDFVKSTISTIGENIKVKRFVRFNLGEGLEKKSQDFAAEVAAQTSAKPVSAPEKEQQPAPTEAVETVDKAPKVAISAALVKQLREETGAGMMDCKKALSETGGDLEKAQEYLRKKGLLTADKKSSRLAAEGRIGSYIHDSRIGVLIEVNCETDFVGRSEKFKDLVEDLAMQVVACPRVEYVSIEDIPESIVNKEKQIEMQREDILSKPENIRGKIVEGRVSKRLGELALLEQAYLKDDTILVKDLVKQSVAAIGENIKVRRFVRFTLGESTESKSETAESSESKSEEAES